MGDTSTGGGVRNAFIWEALKDCGDVDTLVIREGPRCEQAPEWDGRRVRQVTYRERGLSVRANVDRQRVRRWVRSVVAAGSYDVIVARYASVATYVPANLWSRMIFDADDLCKTETPAPLSRLRTVPRTVFIKRLLKRVAHVWFVDRRDMRRFSPLAKSYSWLPNVATRYETARLERKQNTILVVAHLAYPPNALGVQSFLDDVLPALREQRPAVRLRIVGKGAPPQWQNIPSVDVLGFVEDLGVEYAQASLVIAPVITGGGTQVKVIEALTHACPLVASDFSFRGYADDLEPGRHLLVANTPDAWVSACLAILDDEENARRMASEAEAVAADTYGLPAMTTAVRRTITSTADDVASPVTR